MGFAKRAIRFSVPRNIRNWLRSPTRSAEWAWDEIKYALGVKQIVQMRPGWVLRCHPSAYRFAYYAHNSDWEQIAELDGFISACRPGMVLFDVGAHFGLFSLASLHYGGVTAKAIAVDPSETASRITRIQTKLNHVADQLRVINATVTDKPGRLDMVAVGVLASWYFIAPTKDHPKSELTRTRAITVDGLAQEFRTLPTHIKIDVEGHEAAVLRGGQQVLSQADPPVLFIELHNQMVRERIGDPAESLVLLKALGYNTFTVKGVPLGRDNILNRPLIRIMARKANG